MRQRRLDLVARYMTVVLWCICPVEYTIKNTGLACPVVTLRDQTGCSGLM